MMLDTITRPTGGKLAVGYLRRSTDRQEQSIPDQQATIERYASEHGYQVMRYYTDDAVSGATSEGRMGFQQLFTDSQRPECDFRFVLVYDIKRFGRVDNDEAGFYRYTLKRQGIRVVYVKEDFRGTPTDQLILQVKQWQAAEELRSLSVDTIRGMLSRVSEGWWNGGCPPYGYDLAYYNQQGEFLMTIRYMPDGTKQVLNDAGEIQRVLARSESMSFSKADRCRLVLSAPERMETIRSIYHWYAYDGLGFKAIADRLNRQGLSSPRGGTWSAMHGPGWALTTISDLLRNPVYTGDLVWNKLTFAKFYRISGGKAVVRETDAVASGMEGNPEEDWIVIPNTHPQLIPHDLYRMVQLVRHRRRNLQSDHRPYRAGQGAHSHYLLSGLIRCIRCNHYYHGYTTNKGKPRKDGTRIKTYYYACGGYTNKGNLLCTRSIIPQLWLEDWVLERILKQIIGRFLQPGGETRLRLMVFHELGISETKDLISPLMVLQQKKAALDDTIANALTTLTPENQQAINGIIERFRHEQAELDGAIQRHEELKQHRHAIEAQIAGVIQHYHDAARTLANGTLDEKRITVRNFVQRIAFDPDTRTGVVSFWLVPHPVGGGDIRRERAMEMRHVPRRPTPTTPVIHLWEFEGEGWHFEDRFAVPER